MSRSRRERPAGQRGQRGWWGALAILGLFQAAACAAFVPETVGDGPSPSIAPSDTDLFALVPPGPRLLFEVDLAVVRGSVWTAGLLPGGGGTQAGAEVIARANQRAALGYDDATDVDRMVYALTVLDASRPTLVIAQGRFAPAQVEEAFRARWAGAHVDVRRGISVLVEGENSLAFITPRTFVSGPPAEVLAAVDRAFGVGGSLAADPGLGPLWRALSTSAGVPCGGGPAVRGVMSLDTVVRARMATVWAVPRAVTHLGLRVDLGQALDLGVLALTADREAAGALARAWSATARAPQIRRLAGTLGLGALLGGLSIGVDGARVRVTSSIDESQRPEVTQALRAIVTQLRGG